MQRSESTKKAYKRGVLELGISLSFYLALSFGGFEFPGRGRSSEMSLCVELSVSSVLLVKRFAHARERKPAFFFVFADCRSYPCNSTRFES